MKRALIFLLLLSGCGARMLSREKTTPGPQVALPAAKPQARVHFEEGLRLMDDPTAAERAAAAFLAATKADPNLYEAWHDLGIVQARQGRWDAAATSFGRALEVQPGSRKTLLALAEAYLRSKSPGDAVSLLEPVVANLPKADDERKADPAARAEAEELALLLVQALRDAGKLGRALEEAEKLLAGAGRSARAFNALGLIYYRMDKPALAETALRRALELDPKGGKAAEVWNNLGLVLLARGRDREAFDAFDKAVALDDRFVDARLNKAAVLLDCGDYARALGELEKAERARPHDPDVLVALGVAARGAGKPEEARRAYEGALAVAPQLPAAHFNLGILFMDFLPDKAKAREHLRVYRKVAPAADNRQKEAELRLKELRE